MGRWAAPKPRVFLCLHIDATAATSGSLRPEAWGPASPSLRPCGHRVETRLWPPVRAAAVLGEVRATSWAGSRAPPAGQRGPSPANCLHQSQTPAWRGPAGSLREGRKSGPGKTHATPCTMNSVIPFHFFLCQRESYSQRLTSVPQTAMEALFTAGKQRIGQTPGSLYSCFPGFAEIQLPGNPSRIPVPHSWWECKLVQPLWKTVWRFLKKLKIELPHAPAIPLLGIYLGKTLI